MASSTGYGSAPSNKWQNLVFDGDERKFQQWEVKILGYMLRKGLKKVILHEPAIETIVHPATAEQAQWTETIVEDDSENETEDTAQL